MFSRILLIGSVAVAAVMAAPTDYTAPPVEYNASPPAIQSAWFAYNYYRGCSHHGCYYQFYINGTQDVPHGPSFSGVYCHGKEHTDIVEPPGYPGDGSGPLTYTVCSDPTVYSAQFSATTDPSLKGNHRDLQIYVSHVWNADGITYNATGRADYDANEPPTQFLIHPTLLVEVA